MLSGEEGLAAAGERTDLSFIPDIMGQREGADFGVRPCGFQSQPQLFLEVDSGQVMWALFRAGDRSRWGET